MLVIQDQHLGQFVEELRQQWPQSLLVYMLAKNHLERNQFAWPGMEFLVDRFPGHSACIARPCPDAKKTQQGKDYPPRIPLTKYTLSGKDADSARKFLEEPGVIDWSVPCTIGPTPLHLIEALNDVCSQHGKVIVQEGWKAIGLIFRPGHLKSWPTLPEGYTIRPLDRSDIPEVNSIWGVARAPESLRTLLYLYDQGFPTMGAYDKENKLVGFTVCNAEMRINAANVKPEHRNKKLFHLMAYALCETIFALGFELTYAFIAKNNIASFKSMEGLGGERVDWETCFTMFVPKDYDNSNDPLIAWYNNLDKTQAEPEQK